MVDGRRRRVLVVGLCVVKLIVKLWVVDNGLLAGRWWKLGSARRGSF